MKKTPGVSCKYHLAKILRSAPKHEGIFLIHYKPLDQAHCKEIPSLKAKEEKQQCTLRKNLSLKVAQEEKTIVHAGTIKSYKLLQELLCFVALSLCFVAL